MSESRRVFVAEFRRTAFAKAGKGALRSAHPVSYAAHVVSDLLAAARVPASVIDEMLLGCAMPEGATGNNVARAVMVRAGLEHVPATTISTWCASGLEAVALAASRIRAGAANAILAGGVESMTHTWNHGLNEYQASDSVLAAQHPAYYGSPIADADFLTAKHGLSREAADEWALTSHQRAAAAATSGVFAHDITPVAGVDTDGKSREFRVDECVRPGTNAQALAGLAAVGGHRSITTAGNSSQRADGAAVCLLVSESVVRTHGLQPLAELIDFAVVGLDPAAQLEGPTLAVPALARRARFATRDIALWEIHEAFACQLDYCCAALALPPDRTNIYGGAIALGHPFGASGARLVGQLARALQVRGDRYGVLAMCCGGGQGYAMLLAKGEISL
jgi:acetyl-CoA C-acetyltransferase